MGSADRLEVMRAKPLFTIGLFADARYADKDDHERPSSPGASSASARPPTDSPGAGRLSEKGERMACVMNLDIIDGYNDDDVAALVPREPRRSRRTSPSSAPTWR